MKSITLGRTWNTYAKAYKRFREVLSMVASERLTTSVPVSATWKVACAALLGNVIDYYDFYLAAFAGAVVWPQLFFSFLPASQALALSVLTFAVTFFTRPIGAFFFGHIGDKHGRKLVLVLTLTATGVGMWGLALTPDYASIGLLAPALVMLFRAIFGFGLGGEYGGAMSWIAEHAAKSKWRGGWIGLVYSGIYMGVVTSSLAYTIMLSIMNQSSFISYGWRIPFVVGGMVVILGVVLRFKLSESPMFVELQQKKALEKSPAVEAVKKNWRKILLLFWPLAALTTFGNTEANGPLGQAYLINAAHLSPLVATQVLTVASAISVPILILFSCLSDIKGRKLLTVASMIVAFIFSYPAYLLYNTQNVTVIIATVTVVLILTSCNNGILAAIWAENFETKYRATASGLVHTIGLLVGVGTIGGLVYPAFLPMIGGITKVPPMIAGGSMILLAIAIVSLLFVKETKGKELA